MDVKPEVLEARALLQKEWTRYKREEYMSSVAQIDRIMAAQRRALDKLYEESEDLYNEAIMVSSVWQTNNCKNLMIKEKSVNLISHRDYPLTLHIM